MRQRPPWRSGARRPDRHAGREPKGAIALPVHLVMVITELQLRKLTGRTPDMTTRMKNIGNTRLTPGMRRLITTTLILRHQAEKNIAKSSGREQRGSSGGASPFPRTPEGNSPSRRFRRAVASGRKKGLPANRQPLHKGASGMSRQPQPLNGGGFPPPGLAT